jgi:hypothetical protein
MANDGSHPWERKVIPTRWVAEQHVQEDCGGRIPSFSDWCNAIRPEKWMNSPRKLSKELEHEQNNTKSISNG